MAFATVLERLLRVRAASPYSLTLPAADAAGVLRSDGSGVLSLSSAVLALDGVKFPASQVASADANTLDDYEEGVFAIADASGAGVVVTNTNLKYVKFGRVVAIFGAFTYGAVGSGANALLSGWPFTSDPAYGALAVAYTDFGTPGISLMLDSSTAQVQIFKNGTSTRAQNVDMSGKTVRFSGVYLTP